MHWQMYYTSCERGLSGYPGFQFNAATPGTPDEALRRVESLTVYEAPRAIGHTPTEAQIAASPVNLCFDPGDQPVIARVRFAGADYSGRFGNYFVHALLGDGSFDLLPIELWGSPLWATRESASTELPPVPEPLRPGSLTRHAVERFLTSSGDRQRLPALLAAVECAITHGERSVVIYDRDADHVAHWIAAVSYLLPPRLVQRMSFATYQHRPGTSRQHIIGTVPGADFEPSSTAFGTFYLFDFVNGAASEPLDRPLTTVLAKAGPIRSASLWRSAENLGTGTEDDLESWRPLVLAAQVLTGGDLTPADAALVLDWLESAASRLPGSTVEQLGRAVRGARDCDEHQLVRLAALAASTRAADLQADLEIELATLQIGGRGTSAIPLRTGRGREHADKLYRRQLLNDNPDELARLVLLADRHTIRLDPAILAERGRETIGPLLFRSVSEPVRQLLRANPSVRSGVLDHIAAQSFERQIEAFDRLDGIFDERELAARPALHRAALIASARNGGVDKVATVLKISGDRIEDGLLRAVWPSDLKLSEALALIRAAGPVRLPANWIEPLALKPAKTKESTSELFELLSRVNVDEPLSARAKQRIKRMTWALDREREFVQARSDTERGRTAIALIHAHNDRNDVIGDYLLLVVPGMLLELAPKEALDALEVVTSEIRAGYLALVETALAEPGSAAYATAANVYTVAWLAKRGGLGRLSEQVELELVRSLGNWNARAHKQVGKALKKRNERIARSFEPWCELHFRRRLLAKWVNRSRLPHQER